MSSDTSARGDTPALEPQTDPAAPRGRRASDFTALAPDPVGDLIPHGPAGGVPGRRGRGLTVAAAAGIGAAILIMIAASLVRGAWMRPPLVMPAAGPPWEIAVRHVPADLVTYGLWLAALLGTGGVAAGLLAIHRGARLSARILLIAGLHSQLLLATDHFAVQVMTPMVMLTAAIALVGLGLTGRWKPRDSPGAGPGTAAARDAGRLSPAADSVCP